MIAAIIFLGSFVGNRKTFLDATCLLLMSMLLNTALKSIFNIPLPAGLNGLAFPSGHMQSAVVFYGWIAYRCPQKWVRAAVSIVLVGLGQALVHFGYHRYVDIAGALFFGLIALYGYCGIQAIQRHQKNKHLPILFLLCAGLFYFFDLTFSLKKIESTKVFLVLLGILWHKNTILGVVSAKKNSAFME